MDKIDILKQLIMFDTTTNKKNYEVFSYIKSLSDKFYYDEFEFNGYKTLIVKNKDVKKFDYAFLTHIDVVPSDNFDYKIIGDKFYGRGSFDMKGSIATILELLINNNFNKNIGLIITSDEEIGGFNGAFQVLENYDIDFCIVPDGGNNFDIITEEKGVLNLELCLETKLGHASMPWHHKGAAYEMIDIINKIYDKYPNPISEEDYKTSIIVSSIDTNNEIFNQVPSKATVKLDIRFIKDDNKDDIINFIKSLNNNLKVDIINYGENYNCDVDEKFYNTVYKNISRKPKVTFASSASDARFLKCKSQIINPIGGNMHDKDEYVSLKSLDILYNIFYDYIV